MAGFLSVVWQAPWSLHGDVRKIAHHKIRLTFWRLISSFIIFGSAKGGGCSSSPVWVRIYGVGAGRECAYWSTLRKNRSISEDF